MADPNRRRTLRRYLIGALVLVLLVGGGLTVHWLSHSGRPTPPYAGDRRLNEPTHGGLAGDQAFIGQVQAAWRRDLAPAGRGSSQDQLESGETVTGPVDVYWAGDTPAGPAAVVLQRATWLNPLNDRSPVVEIGLVATNPSTHRLALLAARVDVDSATSESTESFAFGPSDATVLTLAKSGFQVFSPYPAVNTATDYVDRAWQDLDYVDGVALFQVGAQGNGRSIVELSARPKADREYPAVEGGPVQDQPVLCDGWQPSSGPGSPDPRLHWPGLLVNASGSDMSGPAWSKVFDDALHDHDAGDLYTEHPSESYWQIVQPISDGITVVLGEELLGSTGRLFAVDVSPDGQRFIGITYCGTIKPDDPLPVRYLLPDARGWLLAAYGSVISTPSRSASDLLVVPQDTTSVTVTPKGGQPQTVALNP